MAESKLPYDRMIQEAMRDVMRKALIRVAEAGLPGAHHFYITFRTGFPGVDIPSHLTATYPEEMTIVLQHQFFGLDIDDVRFEVTLSFNKRLERLKIPFEAVVSFVDPSVSFGLQFQIDGEQIAASPAAEPAAGAPAAAATDAVVTPSAEKVVSLDSFRKK